MFASSHRCLHGRQNKIEQVTLKKTPTNELNTRDVGKACCLDAAIYTDVVLTHLFDEKS